MTRRSFSSHAALPAIAKVLPVLTLSVFGFWICYHYAWQFTLVEPIDNGLIMDPAWRMANGQIPFRDFSMIQGLTAAIVEAPFLAIFGPTIFAAVVHSSTINALAGILAYLILRQVQLPRLPAFMFALFTTVVFYPPEGLAFAVQHGAFVILIAFLAAFYGEHEETSRGRRRAAWLVVGLALGFAYFAKQTLGTVAPGLLIILFAGSKSDRMPRLACMIAGGITPFILLFLLAGANADTFDRMVNFLVTMPWGFGGGRVDADLNEALVVYELATVPTIVLALGASLAGIYMFKKFNLTFPTTADTSATATQRHQGLLYVLIGAVLMIGNVCMVRLDQWNPHLLLQLVFVASGIVAAGIAQIFRSSASANSPSSETLPLSQIIVNGTLIIFIFVGAYDTWWMHANIVKHRGIRNIQPVFGARLQFPDSVYYPAIRGVKFREFESLQVNRKITQRDFILKRTIRDRQQIEFLRSLPYEVIVSGVAKHIQIFAGKVPSIPVINVQPGASSPFRDSKDYELLIRDLERNIQTFKIGGLAFANKQYRRHSKAINARPGIFCGLRSVAEIHLVELCALEDLPKGFGRTIGRVLEFDGELY